MTRLAREKSGKILPPIRTLEPAPHSTPAACCSPSRARNEDTHLVQPQLKPTATAAMRNAVEVPGGPALLGTNEPALAVDGEGPLKKRSVKPFRMDATTVTNARFAEFVAATDYITEAERFGDSFVFDKFLPDNLQDGPRVAAAPWWRAVEGASWRAIYGPGSGMGEPDHPVTHMTWNDALAFAKWAGGRLPTELEWEHAARGGLGDVPFPWGTQAPNDRDFFPCNIWQGNFPELNTRQDGFAGTAPARSFEPNGYGLYNMAGNVWEWTSQAFKVKSLKKSVAQAHAGKDGFKISKGGSFLCHISYCFRYRIAARSGSSPDSSTSHQGFRLVYDIT